MEYLVSAESHPYYHWQIELLVQSFRKTHQEKNLLVVLTESNAPQSVRFNNLIESLPRIQGFQNLGKIRGHEPLNNLYCLQWAVQAGLIQQPFTWLIQPDVVLRHPLDPTFKDYSECFFYPDVFFSFNEAAKIGPFWEWLGKEKSDYQSRWMPIGNIMIFSKLPVDIFPLFSHRAELLATHQLIEDKPISNKTIYLAVATVLSEYSDHIFCKGDYTLASGMLEGTESYFISYEQGMLPNFHKSMFSYAAPNYVAFGNPLQILSENFPSPNAFHVSCLAKDYLKASKD